MSSEAVGQTDVVVVVPAVEPEVAMPSLEPFNNRAACIGGGSVLASSSELRSVSCHWPLDTNDFITRSKFITTVVLFINGGRLLVNG